MSKRLHAPSTTHGAAAVSHSIVAFIILGSVLEGIPAIVLFGPLLFPIAVQAGVHEVHYAMVVIFAMGIGLFAPPFGVGYYGACAISRVDPNEGIGPICKMMDTSFFLARQTLLASSRPGMAIWREKLFAWMLRNAESAMEFFKLPTNRVVELGSQVEI